MPQGRPRHQIEYVCQNPACQKVFTNKPSKKSRFCSRPCWYAFYSNRSPEERFWAFVDNLDGPDACWIWTGGSDRHGYGHFNVESKPHVQMSAYRFSYILHYGPITDGLYVCHNCPGVDNPACVNPFHLFLGTQHDNLMDASRKGRMRGIPRKGADNPKAKLLPEQVYAIRALEGTYSALEVTNQFPVGISTVRRIWNRQYWSHLPERLES